MGRDIYAQGPRRPGQPFHKAEPFVPWKPGRCADCGKPHPCHSRNGREGPWRCGPCDQIAADAPPGPVIEAPAPEAPPIDQGRLL